MKDTHSNNPAIIFHHLCEDFVWREALSTNELFQVSEEIVIFVTVKVTIPDLQKKKYRNCLKYNNRFLCTFQRWFNNDNSLFRKMNKNLPQRWIILKLVCDFFKFVTRFFLTCFQVNPVSNCYRSMFIAIMCLELLFEESIKILHSSGTYSFLKVAIIIRIWRTFYENLYNFLSPNIHQTSLDVWLD